ncbi:MAG: AAA family ATPase [Alphaproteobacteria bacterium]|nr:AAA family ATPase [Alphaproteobacteria bacterium]
MRLSRIHAKNYRTLQNVIIPFQSNFCTISGHNNAGKSCVVRLVLHLLHNNERNWRNDDYKINYDEDKTKWAKDSNDIEIEYNITLFKDDDSALTSLLERLSGTVFGNEINIIIKFNVNKDNEISSYTIANGNTLDPLSHRNFIKELRSSNNLISHNSTERTAEYYYDKGKFLIMYDYLLSPKDRATMARAEGELQKQAKKMARDHKAALNSMLGKLKDKFDVEFSVPEFYSSHKMPLTINLRDRSVEVPLTSWGSGTQNRTHILLSVLGAARIRSKEAIESRTTPIVLVEEPESFLHPSAQAEFGSVLQSLSDDNAVQIIASTHSPFMLNQSHPSSNILLKRNYHRGIILDTIVEDTSGTD